MKQSTFVIANMDCPTEEALIRKRLGAVPGIEELAFNLMERRLTVGHRLPDDGPVARVDNFVGDVRHRARVHVDDALDRREPPRHPVRVGVELDAHGARRVDLRVDGRGRAVEVAQPGHAADLLVERDQREAEREHAGRDDRQPHEQRAVRRPDRGGALAHRLISAGGGRCRTAGTAARPRRLRRCGPCRRRSSATR